MATRATTKDEGGRADTIDQLLERSGGRDTEACAGHYDRLVPRVFGLVTCLVGDDAAAHRMTCEAFVEAWRRAPTYDPSQSATSWTLAIAHRIVVRATRVDDPLLLAARLDRFQAGALQLAWSGGLDHRRIDDELGADVPATRLLTEVLQLQTPIGPRP